MLVSISRRSATWRRSGNRSGRVGTETARGTGRRGVGKRRTVGKLVEHAIKEMDKWVVNDRVLSGSMRVLVVPQSYLRCAPGYKGVVNDDGVEAEEALELSRELVLDPLPFVFSKSSREPCGHFELSFVKNRKKMGSCAEKWNKMLPATGLRIRRAHWELYVLWYT